MTLPAGLLVMAMSALATVVVAGIEILARSFGGEESQAEWSLRACLTKAMAAYVLVSVMWNAAGSYIALYLLRTKYMAISEWLGLADYLLAVVAGVLALGFVLSNTEIIVFNKTVSTYVNWVALLRPAAISSVQERHSRRKQDLQRDIESALKSDVPLDQMQTHLLNCFGTDEIAKLEKDARQSDADSTLYKAMQLAERYPKVARSLVKHWGDKGSQRSL